jgi:hypothetical protein
MPLEVQEERLRYLVELESTNTVKMAETAARWS